MDEWVVQGEILEGKFMSYWHQSGIEQRMVGYNPNDPATIKAEKKRKKAELRAELERLQQIKAKSEAKEAQLAQDFERTQAAQAAAAEARAAAPKAPAAGKRKRDDVKPVAPPPRPVAAPVVETITEEEKHALANMLEHVIPPEDLFEFLQASGVVLTSSDVSTKQANPRRSRETNGFQANGVCGGEQRDIKRGLVSGLGCGGLLWTCVQRAVFWARSSQTPRLCRCLSLMRCQRDHMIEETHTCA
jgi:hypothetical protein